MEELVSKNLYEVERNKSMPSKNHAFVQRNLLVFLVQKYSNSFQTLPEISLMLEDKKYVPDLSLFSELKFTSGQDEVHVYEIPLATIEILSPTQNIGDLLVKAQKYFSVGVKSYWLLIPDLKSVYVFSGVNEYTIFAKEDILKDELLGVEVPLKRIFQ